MYTTEDLHFRFSPGSPAAQSEEWEEVVSNTHLPMSVRPSPQPGGGRFFGRIRRQSLDDLALVDCACGACTGSRGRARIAAGDDDYVGLMITRTGSEVMSFGGVERVHLPGTLLTWDTEATVRLQIPQSYVKRSLIVPRAALAEIPAGRSFTPGVVLDRSSPAVRLLVSHLNSVWRILPQMSNQTVADARRATLDLFAAVITPAMRRELVRSSTIRTAVERWIDRQLPFGDVSPHAAAAAHGVSLRTLHRTFASGGPSFSSYVRQRRLARARDELGDPGVLISSVAYRWGYADPSQFGRIFRTQYGMSPGDYRGTTA